MNALLAIARAVHFAATLWLFGELTLACILSVGRRTASSDGPGEAQRRRLPRIARTSLIVGIASAGAWLATVAEMMSDMPLVAGDCAFDARHGPVRAPFSAGSGSCASALPAAALGDPVAAKRRSRLEARVRHGRRCSVLERARMDRSRRRGRRLLASPCSSSAMRFTCSPPAHGSARCRRWPTCSPVRNRSSRRHRRSTAFPTWRSRAWPR